MSYCPVERDLNNYFDQMESEELAEMRAYHNFLDDDAVKNAIKNGDIQMKEAERIFYSYCRGDWQIRDWEDTIETYLKERDEEA